MEKKMTLAFIAAIAGVSMALTSCSDESLAPSAAVSGEDVYMTFTTRLPTGISTYADDDAAFGNSSLEGGFKNLEGKGDYYVRYIMEIYKYDDSADDKCGERVERQIKYKPLTADADYRHLDFTGVRLKNDTKYITLFWSDIVMKFSQAPTFTNPSYEGKTVTIDGIEYDNLTSIADLNTSEYYANPYFYSNPEGEGYGKVLYNAYMNRGCGYGTYDDIYMFFERTDIRTVYSGQSLQPIAGSESVGGAVLLYPLEMHDGYYAKEILYLNGTTSSDHAITLKRPFAKLRVVTTDADKVAETIGLNADDVDWAETILYKSIGSESSLDAEPKPVFNLLTEQPESHKTVSHNMGYWTLAIGKTGIYSSEGENGDRTLGVFYIPGNQINTSNWSLSYELTTKKAGVSSEKQMPTVTVYSLPLVTNKVTTIKGSLLSAYHGDGDISISIDDGLEEYTPEYGTVEF